MWILSDVKHDSVLSPQARAPAEPSVRARRSNPRGALEAGELEPHLGHVLRSGRQRVVVASRSRNRSRGRPKGSERPFAEAESQSRRRTGLLLLMDRARPPGLAESALLRFHDRQGLDHLAVLSSWTVLHTVVSVPHTAPRASNPRR